MNFRRTISIITILILSLFLTACEQKPELIVEDYVRSMQDFNLEKMQELTLQHDSNKEFEAELQKINQDSIFNFLKENAELIEYEILESDVKDNKGSVRVKFKFVDATSLIGEILVQYLEKAMVSAFSGQELDDEQIEKMLKDIFDQTYKSWEQEFEEREIDIPVEKKDGKWYVAEVSEKLLDVAFSNTITALINFSEDFNN